LQATYLSELAQSNPRPNTVQEEWKETAQKALKKLHGAFGKVSNSLWYQPTEKMPEMTDEDMVKLIPCPMCAI